MTDLAARLEALRQQVGATWMVGFEEELDPRWAERARASRPS